MVSYSKCFNKEGWLILKPDYEFRDWMLVTNVIHEYVCGLPFFGYDVDGDNIVVYNPELFEGLEQKIVDSVVALDKVLQGERVDGVTKVEAQELWVYTRGKADVFVESLVKFSSLYNSDS